MSYAFVRGLNANPGASDAQTTAFTLAAGQSIIAVAADVNNNSATLTVSDSLSNTYTQRGTFNDPDDGGTYQIWDCLAPNTTGSVQVKSHSGSASPNNAIQILVYTGLSSFSAGSFKTAHANSESSTLATTAITPTTYPAMVFCVANSLHNATQPTVGSGFTKETSWINYDGGNDMYTEDIAVTSGTQTGNWTWTVATTSVIIMTASYIQSVVGGPVSYFLPTEVEM